MFNPTTDRRYAVFFTKCTAELHATKWDDVAKFDKLATLDRLIWTAAVEVSETTLLTVRNAF